MLEAKDADGRLVLSWYARRGKPYWCPECDGDLFVKKPFQDIIDHYCHRPDSTCPSKGRSCGGETTQHRISKTLIYEYLKAQGCDVEMEQRVYHDSDTRRRWRKPDVLLKSSTPPTAIEVQNSPMTEPEFRERCRHFKDAGMRVRWVFPFSSANFDSLTKVGGSACCRPSEHHLLAFNIRERDRLGTRAPYLIDVATGQLLMVDLCKLTDRQVHAYYESGHGYKRVGKRRTKVRLPPPMAFVMLALPINLNVNDCTGQLIRGLATLRTRKGAGGMGHTGVSAGAEADLASWRSIRKGIVPEVRDLDQEDGSTPHGYEAMWRKPKPVEASFERWTNQPSPSPEAPQDDDRDGLPLDGFDLHAMNWEDEIRAAAAFL